MSTPRQKPQSRNEFHIAIACALPHESGAVRDVFDEEWQNNYGKLPNDFNSYSTGRISYHNVVLVYLAGMGTAASASSIANVGHTFPNITLILLVGICGGYPNGEYGREIMLGDVVISNSIVQYAYGRRYPDRVRRKNTVEDSLPRHAPKIRSFLHKLLTTQDRTKLQERTRVLLDELTRNHPISYRGRPPPETDLLFPSSYRHKHQVPNRCSVCDRCQQDNDEVCDAALRASCATLQCSTSNAVPRQDRSQGGQSGTHPYPWIHFGSVASADEVMKSGLDRDIIADEESVIAFEMEGAGVWDNFPSIIIKGVADYADSHKNKTWQPYAAAAAACCMKAVLEEWIPTDPIGQEEARAVENRQQSTQYGKTRRKVRRSRVETLPPSESPSPIYPSESASSRSQSPSTQYGKTRRHVVQSRVETLPPSESPSPIYPSESPSRSPSPSYSPASPATTQPYSYDSTGIPRAPNPVTYSPPQRSRPYSYGSSGISPAPDPVTYSTPTLMDIDFSQIFNYFIPRSGAGENVPRTGGLFLPSEVHIFLKKITPTYFGGMEGWRLEFSYPLHPYMREPLLKKFPAAIPVATWPTG